MLLLKFKFCTLNILSLNSVNFNLSEQIYERITIYNLLIIMKMIYREDSQF